MVNRIKLSLAAVLLFLMACGLTDGGETNFWPFMVRQADSPQGRFDHTGSLGPLFSITDRGETRILSIRPLWTSFTNEARDTWSGHVLYPFVNLHQDGPTRYGHVLNLLKYRFKPQDDTAFLQLFPFVFSNQTPREEDSYFAIWPMGGVLKNRFWRDRITFYAWPLFVETVRGDETRTHVPYPFVQTLRGPKSRGFGIWPLYGRFERENDYIHRWALWPVHYHYRDNLDEEVPYERFGIWPFYHRETDTGLRSESFVWPFFGYTREFEPRTPYAETRYFWPFLVQGRGGEQYINRWLPLYANERSPGKSKSWYLWPLLKLETFEQPGLRRERTSLFYFLFREERQHFAGTTARKSFLWPFTAYWNDGFDRRQFQFLDPLTVFFPRNKVVRENWTPLFALYRFDERAGNRRHSFFWDLVVWESDPDGLNAVYAGPLFEWVDGSHWEVLNGLIGRSGEDDNRKLRLFWQR